MWRLLWTFHLMKSQHEYIIEWRETELYRYITMYRCCQVNFTLVISHSRETRLYNNYLWLLNFSHHFLNLVEESANKSNCNFEDNKQIHVIKKLTMFGYITIYILHCYQHNPLFHVTRTVESEVQPPDDSQTKEGPRVRVSVWLPAKDPPNPGSERQQEAD